MCAFDLGHVEETRGIADEGAAGEGALGDGLVATFIEGSGGVGDTFTALKDGGVGRVVLHLLELAVGGEPGVLVVEADDETNADEVVAEVIHPAAAVGFVGERIAHCVENLTLTELGGIDLPDFFHAKAVRLVLAISSEVKLLHDLLGQATMAALRE